VNYAVYSEIGVWIQIEGPNKSSEVLLGERELHRRAGVVKRRLLERLGDGTGATVVGLRK
jgi:hypothetical protein